MVKIDTKKILFTLSGLALAILVTMFMQTYSAHAAVKEGEKFGDWVVGCEKDAKGKKLCFLSQTLVSQKEKEAQNIATFRIGYYNSKELKILQILPFGVSLQAGTSIIISKDKMISPGKFTTCQAIGCFAVADLTKSDVTALVEAKEAYIGIMSIEGKQINLGLSTKGLKEGLETLK